MSEIERRQNPSGRRVFDETKDATRRTRLANERTYLAWWRTGLTSLAVAVGLGRIVPGVTDVTQWPYQLGVAFIAVRYVRVRTVERAVARGDFPRLDERLELALIGVSITLGLATTA